ncbi:dihydrofolate synthase/folylpolyglutamate synthase [Caulobacter ginsengisoli]|uniref:Dihydrofolate synthase/folylpolyglutamate synthase n=1 Tax=Caulobacter ginsengisoli TaxID=400775 RepID=A0ABU0IZR2_9CAUL|nr:folylpolyglutamate synthase/dihydrofolate synthase family protein [Caulobacter ginsengisoli]MDQ0466845.1 dihydrofolate synthase/folylpolyglutamate synthase [Caulobacter ginsengisoli]
MSDHLLPHDAALERLRRLHPKVIDLSLERMARLCRDLGDPQDRLPPVIHVAGTNGKGSTVAYLRAIAEAAGLRVHVFTSPHLVRFVERIRLAGTLITSQALADLLDRVEEANAGQSITFFEFVTAAAFLAFAETPADLCIVEVGLGGSLDASNVISRPAVSVIAPVDLDHKEFLGEDLAQIAGEKAGIIKPGCPAVSARQRPEAQEVIEARAAAMGAPLTQMGVAFDAWAPGGRLLVQTEDRLLDLPLPALPGPHQIANAGLAVMAALTLGDPRIDEAAIGKGIASAVWPARFQRLTAGPFGDKARAAGTDLWLDGGHNPHAARALADTIAELTARDGRSAVLILGLLANKDADGVLAAFAGSGVRVLAIPFEAEAAGPPERLVEAAEKVGVQAQACQNVEAALDLALSLPGPPHVVIGGSLYLAGEILALSEETWPR